MSRTIESANPLVSVVIPTYNNARYLGCAIESAMVQTYANIEIIVVDDGSTDNTKEVCAGYGNKIRYLNKPNGGIASALNHGIEHMQGSWLKWLSSDDLLVEDSVKILLEFAKMNDAKIVYGDFDIIDENNKFVRTYSDQHYDDYYEFASALWEQFIGCAGTTLIHRSCFDIVGLFNENLRYAEDYEWWLRACMLHRYRFFYIPKVLYKYRQHSSQLSSKLDSEWRTTHRVKLKANIKAEIVSKNKKWWETLAKYQKSYYKRKYTRQQRIRFLLRRFLLQLPVQLRIPILTLYNKLKSSR